MEAGRDYYTHGAKLTMLIPMADSGYSREADLEARLS
jgi:hypothetical protein